MSEIGHRVVMLFGVIGFVGAMTVRADLSSVRDRALLAGLAGGCLGAVLWSAQRWFRPR
jgi:hypothetical protein